MKSLSQISVIFMKHLSHFGHLRLAGMHMGLKMNIAYTNVMIVHSTQINVCNVLIENGEGCVGLYEES